MKERDSDTWRNTVLVLIVMMLFTIVVALTRIAVAIEAMVN